MNKVAIAKCENYNEELVYNSLIKLFDSLGGVDKFIKKGMKVCLKPNLLTAKSPEVCATTHPYVVGAMGRIINECGAKAILVESPGGPYINSYLKRTYKSCGMSETCEKNNIELNYDLSVVSKVIKTERNTRKISVLKPLTECDLIINISKMKTHAMMIFTGAIKNMFGAIAGTEKAVYHINSADYDKFANDLIDIFNIVKPNLNIMDGIIAMEGAGPAGGDPKDVGLLLLSENGFALDSAVHDILEIDKKQSYIIKNAVLRNIDISYEAVLEKIEDVKVSDFNVPFQINKNSNGFLSKFMNNSKSKPVLLKDKCIGCKICQQNCPAECIEMVDKKPVFDYTKCIRCFCCQELCPENAIIAKKSLLVKILSGGR